MWDRDAFVRGILDDNLGIPAAAGSPQAGGRRPQRGLSATASAEYLSMSTMQGDSSQPLLGPTGSGSGGSGSSGRSYRGVSPRTPLCDDRSTPRHSTPANNRTPTQQSPGLTGNPMDDGATKNPPKATAAAGLSESNPKSGDYGTAARDSGIQFQSPPALERRERSAAVDDDDDDTTNADVVKQNGGVADGGGGVGGGGVSKPKRQSRGSISDRNGTADAKAAHLQALMRSPSGSRSPNVGPLMTGGAGDANEDDDEADLLGKGTNQQGQQQGGGFRGSNFFTDTAFGLSSPTAAYNPGGALGDPQKPGTGEDDDENTAGARMMFRFALLFINFTFVVAAMLMIMAGIVPRGNSAVILCDGCSNVTLASMILGGIMWLFALLAFNWIRQRNILFLLMYVALVLFITIASGGILIYSIWLTTTTGGDSGDKGNQTLETWTSQVRANSTEQMAQLCSLQQQNNCSGFFFGCCAPHCWPDPATPPWWVADVCPPCAGQRAAENVCTADLWAVALQRNIGGFVVMIGFAMVLSLTGIALAFFARKIGQSL